MNPALRWLTPDAPGDPLVRSPRARIFLISFALLFLELLCIRWIPSYVRFLAFFTNFLLMASFLGIGLGILAARRAKFYFPPFVVMLLAVVLVTAFNQFDLRISSPQLLYYGVGESQGAKAENYMIVPLVFTLVAAAFIPLARPLGVLLAKTEPLTAYTFDILGSLAGTAAFFVVAWFALPPLAWFGALALIVVALGPRRLLPAAGTVAILAVSVGIAWNMQREAYWSPYYKIIVRPADPTGYILDVNNAGGHQTMMPWQLKEPFYRRIYELFPGPSFEHALILGAGSGSDVATALAKGVPSVEAVEIDPTIQALGQQLNSDRPYSDPRVHATIDDGRSFLRTTDRKFDLIIFALPDSLTLTSGQTTLRLESFLLTEEAIASARSRLTDRGLLVLYNYYRQDWLVQKLATMVGTAFQQDPLVSTYGGWGRAAVIMAGPRLASLPAGQFGAYHEQPVTGETQLRVIGEGFFPRSDVDQATDDWPFLYLRQKTFPTLYIGGIATIALISLFGTFTIAPGRVLRRFDGHMFFLGVAFSLLEVKSLITFALLFGSTWRVNSMVFFAILTSVLCAVLVNRRWKITHVGLLYALLFGALAVAIALPPETLLLSNAVLRYGVASVLSFAPVFLANVIFSNSFKDSDQADVAFASNLLGIMVGGMLEYFSMLVGYRWLLIVVVLFYALALWRQPRAQAAAGLAAAT
jgi:hypothetical protein